MQQLHAFGRWSIVAKAAGDLVKSGSGGKGNGGGSQSVGDIMFSSGEKMHRHGGRAVMKSKGDGPTAGEVEFGGEEIDILGQPLATQGKAHLLLGVSVDHRHHPGIVAIDDQGRGIAGRRE